MDKCLRLMAAILFVTLAATTSQAQTLNYTNCTSLLDEMLSRSETFSGIDVSSAASGDEDYSPPGRLIEEGEDASWSTVVRNRLLPGGQNEQVAVELSFGIERRDGAFACTFYAKAELAQAISQKYALTSTSEINRWHAAFVRATNHLKRLAAQ